MKTALSLLVAIAFSLPALALADATHGKELYGKLCASCHGAEGKGDGPIGAALPADQKPRDFTSAVFKVATDDTKMKEIIQKGGVAFGLSPLMAPQASLTDADLTDLVAVVRSFKK